MWECLLCCGLGVLKYVICDGCCVLCLYCDAWSCRCSCMGSMSVLPCICCMFVSRVHHVAVLNAELCMLVAYAGCDHMKEAYSRVRRRSISLIIIK